MEGGIAVYFLIGLFCSFGYTNELVETKQYNYVLPMTISIMFLWPISETIYLVRWFRTKIREYKIGYQYCNPF